MPEPYAERAGYQLAGRTLDLFLNAALSAVGTPYKWGGNSLAKGVDCSGLVYVALLNAGYRPPRTAATLQGWTKPIDQKQARPGDLVFWDQASPRHDRVTGADHVGIYLGNGKVLEASSGQGKVVIRSLWGNYHFKRVQAYQGSPTPQPYGNSGLTVQNYKTGKPPTAPPPSGPEGEPSTDPAYNAGTSLPPTLAHNASEKEIVDFIIENYGLTARAFLEIPELRKALVAAAQAGAVGDRGLEYVYKTKWWKSRTEAQRTWDILEKSNPKEAADRLAKRRAALSPLWEQYGVDESIATVAHDFERLGMNDSQLTIRMAKSLQAESERTGLDRGTKGATDADELLRIARMEYLTPVDRQTAERWAIKAIRTGQSVEDQWRGYLASLAAPRFSIDPTSGVVPADLMAPVKMSLAENLEMQPDSIDLLSPEFNDVLQIKTDEGTYRPMTVAEATQWARSQEGFKTTKVAEKATSDLAEALGKAFGKVG